MAGSEKVENQLVTSLNSRTIPKIRAKKLGVKFKGMMHNHKCTHFFSDIYVVCTTTFLLICTRIPCSGTPKLQVNSG